MRWTSRLHAVTLLPTALASASAAPYASLLDHALER